MEEINTRDRSTTEVVINDNDIYEWNRNTELFCKSVGEICADQIYLHSRSVYIYKLKYNILSVMTIIIEIVTGAGLFSSFSSSENFEIFATVLGILIIMGTIINSVKTFINYPKLQESHKLSKNEYTNLYLTINTQLSDERKNRQDAKFFKSWVQTTFSKINSDSKGTSTYLAIEFRIKFGRWKYNINNLEKTTNQILTNLENNTTIGSESNETAEQDIILDSNKVLSDFKEINEIKNNTNRDTFELQRFMSFRNINFNQI